MRRIVIVMFIFLFLCFPVTSVIAQELSFSDNTKAMNQAAQSVVMLRVYDTEKRVIALGSGFFIIDSKTIVTNFHVIEGAYSIEAITENNQIIDIPTLVNYDQSKDIAILQTSVVGGVQPLSLANSDDVVRGQKVIAIGSPLGVVKNAISTGIISSIDNDDVSDKFTFSAPISNGSSGGALLNENGQVIGITSATYTDGQNLNIAITSNEISSLIRSKTTPQSIQSFYLAHAVPVVTTVHHGKLTVVTDAAFSPYEFYTENGDLAGIEIDILKYVANQLSLQFSIILAPFDEMWGYLGTDADCTAGGCEYIVQRKNLGLPTDTYGPLDTGDGNWSPVFYVDKSNDDLVVSINEILSTMKKDGTMNQIIATYVD